MLGQDVPPADVARILEPLGFARASGPTPSAAHGRVDGARRSASTCTREVDLIEEVGRHYGFDRLPATFPALDAPQPPPDARDRRAIARVRQVLHARRASPRR